MSLSEADAFLLGEDSGDQSPSTLVIGDTNGDDVDDVVVGVAMQGAGGYHSGSSYLVLGGSP